MAKKHRVSMLEYKDADAILIEQKLKKSVIETADFS